MLNISVEYPFIKSETDLKIQISETIYHNGKAKAKASRQNVFITIEIIKRT